VGATLLRTGSVLLSLPLLVQFGAGQHGPAADVAANDRRPLCLPALTRRT
jgi:hypothetical protein